MQKIVVGKQTNANGSKFDNGDRPKQARLHGADLSLALHFNGGDGAWGSIVCLNQQSENLNYSQDMELARRLLGAGQSVFGMGNRDESSTILPKRQVDQKGFVFGNDAFLGNVAGAGRETTYTRAIILELEFLNADVAAMGTLNGPNASTVRLNYANAAARASINDLLVQPASPTQ